MAFLAGMVGGAGGAAAAGEAGAAGAGAAGASAAGAGAAEAGAAGLASAASQIAGGAGTGAAGPGLWSKLLSGLANPNATQNGMLNVGEFAHGFTGQGYEQYNSAKQAAIEQSKALMAQAQTEQGYNQQVQGNWGLDPRIAGAQHTQAQTAGITQGTQQERQTFDRLGGMTPQGAEVYNIKAARDAQLAELQRQYNLEQGNKIYQQNREQLNWWDQQQRQRQLDQTGTFAERSQLQLGNERNRIEGEQMQLDRAAKFYGTTFGLPASEKRAAAVDFKLMPQGSYRQSQPAPAQPQAPQDANTARARLWNVLESPAPAKTRPVNGRTDELGMGNRQYNEMIRPQGQTQNQQAGPSSELTRITPFLQMLASLFGGPATGRQVPQLFYGQ